MVKIGFGAISQAHQFLHWIPVALELARRPGVRVQVLSASKAGLDFVRRYDPERSLDLVHLRTPRFWRDDLFSPPWRRLTLFLHWRQFQGNDLIVTTESSTEFLKLHTPFSKPLVRMRHGAGDRAGSYRPKMASFDGVIVNGEKDKQQLVALGLMPADRIAVCGYCKFEAIAPPFDPFANGRPIAIYNPHFEEGTSSWFGHHDQILGAMAGIPDWNFIVAPHVKLAKGRSLQPSPAPNVIIDPGSLHSIDMSYVESASVYIGDASSQVYEFIRRPRPCIFLNPDRHDWRDNPHFQHWTFGQVIEDPLELGSALARAAELQPLFEPIQRAALESSIDISSVPASIRHADALLQFATHGKFG